MKWLVMCMLIMVCGCKTYEPSPPTFTTDTTNLTPEQELELLMLIELEDKK